MENIQVTSLPKNNELLWLQEQNQHRSYAIFHDGKKNTLKSRRCDTYLSDHIKHLENGEIHLEVFKYIRSAGFGGVFKSGFPKIDHVLIMALVERWRPETHTFHFPIGEATVTLQDVQVIWGLPIDGPVVSGTWASLKTAQWLDVCNEKLGIQLEEEELKAGRVIINTLVDHLDDPLADNEEAYQQRARTYLLAMFAGHLFVDSSQYDISLNFLENLTDLSVDGRLSWGSAIIAYLYKNLCKATHPDKKGIQGPLLLLQYWAWERMPLIAPGIVRGHEYNYQHCYAARWRFPLTHTETPANVRVTYRSSFTALTNEQFRWTPYEGILHLLPDECTNGRRLWTYSGWVVFWSSAEPHLAHRVTRQFGFIQAIPVSDGLLTPQEHAEAHRIQWIGSRNVNWVQKLERYVTSWNERHGRIFVRVQGVTTTWDYMQWYYDRTVLCVTNPSHQGSSSRYPEWGARQQLYQEGFREIHDRAQQIIERDPTQSQIMQDFVNLPRRILEVDQSEERMNYSSQNFHFPGGAYQPGPQGGAYHSGPSGGAYYPGPSGSAYQPGPPGGAYHSGPSGGAYYPGPSGGGYNTGPAGAAYHTVPSNFTTLSTSTPHNLFSRSNNPFT